MAAKGKWYLEKLLVMGELEQVNRVSPPSELCSLDGPSCANPREEMCRLASLVNVRTKNKKGETE